MNSRIPPALREKFASRLPQRLDTVIDGVRRALESGDAGDWQTAGRATHQLAGTAGSYGFADTAARLRTLEDAITREDRAQIISCVDDLERDRGS